MRFIGVSRAVTSRRRWRGRRGPAGMLLIILAVVAAACGSDGGDTTDVASQAPTAVQSEPSEVATKDAVDPLAAPDATSEQPTAEASEEPATAEPASSEPEAAQPSAADAQPVGDLNDLASVSAAITGAIGRTDVTAALGEVGPFPAEIPFPDDAVLLEVSMSETDSRVLLGDPDVIRPINTMTGGTALTLLKIEEAQDFYLGPLVDIGFEVSPSGFSTTTQGDGTEVRSGLLNRGGTDHASPLREHISLTLVARPDTDYVEIDLSYNTDAEGELASPVTRWTAGLPTPEGYAMHSARVTTFYFGSPSLSFNASYTGPAGQVQQGVEQMMAALPGGGFEVGADAAIGGEDDLRIFDLVYPGVGDGEVAVSESSDSTAIRPSIDVDFPLPASLEPFLLQ